MSKKSEKSEKKKTEPKGTRGKISGTVACVGEVRFNPDTNKIEVVLDRGRCRPEAIKDIVENLVTGAEVEVILPAQKAIDDLKKSIAKKGTEYEELAKVMSEPKKVSKTVPAKVTKATG